MNKIKKTMINNKYLNNLQFITNWVCQGIGHADRTEKIYKLFFSIFAWLVSFFVLNILFGYSLISSILIGFIIGHTLNWLINCNLSVIFIHRMKWRETSKFRLTNHLEGIRNRLQNKNWLLYSVSHGGICRGTLNCYSDIDVSLIRKPGLKNALLAIIFSTKEKKYADFMGIPMDIMISDSPEDCMIKSKYQKNPIVLSDSYNIVDNYYTTKEKITIEEAKQLNNVK